MLFGNAVTVVTHHEHDELGVRTALRAGDSFARDVLNADLNDALVSRQSVAGVEAEIEHDLLNLRGVSDGIGGFHAGTHLDGNLGIDAVLEKVLHVGKQALQIGGLANVGAIGAAGVAEK